MKIKFMPVTFNALIAALLFALPLPASDTSDAEGLRERCEREVKPLEVCVANFGDAADRSGLQDAIKKLKLGKLKIAQAKYKDAIGVYNAYLKLQREIYTSLAEKYIERTKKINDEVAEDLVDSIDKAKVDHYFKLAHRNLEDAKQAMTINNPVLAIDKCRHAKKYAVGIYGLVGKPVPEKYKPDLRDAEGRIAGK